MAPKARGRHTDEQIRRETEGLKWKSASTLDRQRKRKKNRQNKMRARTPTRDEAAPRTKARPLLPHQGHALVAGGRSLKWKKTCWMMRRQARPRFLS